MALYSEKIYGEELYNRQEIWAQRITTIISSPEQAQKVTSYKIDWNGETGGSDAKIDVFISFDDLTWQLVPKGVLTVRNCVNPTCAKLKIYLATKDLSQIPVLHDLNYELRTSLIQDGPLIQEAVFNYIPVTDCLNSLAEKAGFWWNIDSYHRLNFLARSTYRAPWWLTASDLLGEPNITNGNPQYRNTQYVLGGKDITNELTETKPGDGQSRSFTVGFPMAQLPRIFVKLSGETEYTEVASDKIGTKGKDDNQANIEWFWSKGDATLVQKESLQALQYGDFLQIKYRGEFPVVAIYKNSREVDRLRGRVGSGTGLVENVAKEDTNSKDAALQSAVRKIAQYAVDGKKLQFKTDRKGLKPGQLLTVDLPKYGLTSDKTQMLIQSVQVKDNTANVIYDVTAVEGPVDGSWAQFFYNMAQVNQYGIIRENIDEKQTLLMLWTFSKTWQESDSANILRTVYPSSSLYPDNTLYPQFTPEERIKYVALIDDQGNEIFRTAPLVELDLDTEPIISTFYIACDQANMTITKIRWYGGALATISPGTGVLIAEENYPYEKKEIEAIQIERTDTKGW